MNTKIKSIKENLKLENQLSQLETHRLNLVNQYRTLTSARAYKLWQQYNKIKKSPKYLLKAFNLLSQNKRNNHITRNYHQNEVQKAYHNWFLNNYPKSQTIKKQSSTKFKYKPLISIITPVYDPDPKWLIKCIDSVIKQSYKNWELCLADDCSTNPEIKKILNRYSKTDKRIKVVFRRKNGHISKSSNSALKLATGEYVGLLDHDDELWPNALFETVNCLNKEKKIDFLYSDEDKIETDGTHCDPFLKPNWSPNFLLSTNYITHFSVIRKRLVDKIKGFRIGYEGSQDYDLFLRITSITNNVYHIPKILYSWRKIPNSTASVYSVKSYAHLASKKALKDHIKRNKLRAQVKEGLKLGAFKIHYKIKNNPKVSIIIPTKDKLGLLKKCITSIIKKTNYKNYDINIVDTGSINKNTVSYLQKLKDPIKVIKIKQNRFNFSQVNNIAVQKTSGQYLLFLNNDTEIINSNWLEEMLQLAQLNNVGPVGAKLIYPNSNIQHAGIEILSNYWPHHFSIGYPDNESFGFPYLNYKDVTKNPSAVTGACLLINKQKFHELGGFDENFPLEFQDVILSLKSKQLGYWSVYTPYAKLIHHESQSIKDDRSWNTTMEKFNQLKNKYSRILTPLNPVIDEIYTETKQVVNFINSYVNKKETKNKYGSKSKNILIISHLYWPSIGGGEKLFQNIAEKLSHQNKVTVLTSKVTSTDQYFTRSNNVSLPKSQILNDVNILRDNVDLNNGKYLFWHKFGKKFKKIWFKHTIFFFGPFFNKENIKELSRQKWDWIICGPAPTSTILYGWILKKLTKAKLGIVPCMHTQDKLHTSPSVIKIIKSADLILTLTKNENQYLIKNGIDKNKITTIGVGVDDYLITSPKTKYPAKDYILYLGQEGAHKNIPLLIDSMISIWKKGYKNKLIIAGAKSAYSPIIDEKIDGLNKKYRKFVIRINNFDDKLKIKLLDNCLVMVNPSSYESFGIVFIEAWARKKPVIGANIPAVKHLISNEENGLLFKDKNINSLSTKILKIIKDPQKSEKLGYKGYNLITKKYNWKKISVKLQKLIN